MVKPEILRRIEPTGALDRIKASQLRVLNQLMNNARIARLVEQEALDGAAAYKPTTFFADVRKGIWRELEAPAVNVDAFRRNTQRAYLEVMGEKLNGRTAPTDDTRGLVRASCAPSTRDAARAGEDDRPRDARASRRRARPDREDPRSEVRRAGGRAAAMPAAAPGFEEMDAIDLDSCWPDYAVRVPPQQ